jgi:hypothetical protein
MNYVQQFIFFLQQRKALNLLLVFLYFILIEVMHNSLVQVSVWIEKNLTIEIYNLLVAGVFLFVIILLLLAVAKRLQQNKDEVVLKVFYLTSTLLLIIVHSRFMFDSNIEVIHSFEFTVLAFLLFPFTRRFGAAILFTLPFMLVDEWYQYTVLYPWIDYFDLNDVLMDTYGCGLFITLLFVFGVKGSTNARPFYKRTEFISLFAFAIIILVLAKLCFVAAYTGEACNNTLLVMNKSMTTESFWRAHPTHHISYHVMKPLEGLAAIIAIHIFYMGLDSLRKYTT